MKSKIRIVDKPIKLKTGAGRTMATEVLTEKREHFQKTTRVRAKRSKQRRSQHIIKGTRPSEQEKISLAANGVRRKLLQHVKAKSDMLLDKGLSPFERKLVQQCREDGMSDSEILEWILEF